VPVEGPADLNKRINGNQAKYRSSPVIRSSRQIGKGKTAQWTQKDQGPVKRIRLATGTITSWALPESLAVFSTAVHSFRSGVMKKVLMVGSKVQVPVIRDYVHRFNNIIQRYHKELTPNQKRNGQFGVVSSLRKRFGRSFKQ
jgi:hypothetical protein